MSSPWSAGTSTTTHRRHTIKITTNKAAPAFQPVTVSITLESQVEVDALLQVTGNNRTAAAAVSRVPEKSQLIGDILGAIYNKLN